MTAEPEDNNASIEIICDETIVENRSEVVWKTGENHLSIKVTNGDKVKTYNVVVTKEGSKETWYGVEWDYSDPSPILKRLGAAESFIDPLPATSLEDAGYSPFDNIMPWAGMERYNIIDGEVAYSEDDEGFSQTDYDTVVYIPEFWFKAVKDVENQKWTWAVSPTEQDGFMRHPGSNRYVGRYHTSGSSSAVFTKSGVVPLTKTTQTNFRMYSHNKGANWYMNDLATWSAIQMLYLVEFANFDSQTTLGTGYAGVTFGVAEMGGTDSAAYHTLKLSKDHNQYRWIEDPWSNCYDWLDGYVGSRSQTYAEASDIGYSGDTTDLTPLGFGLGDSGTIHGFGYSDAAPWAFIPDKGSWEDYTIFVCDRVSSGVSSNPVAVGGNASGSVRFGLFHFYGSDPAEYTNSQFSSRLLYIPTKS